MMQYSLLDRRPEETILQLLSDYNIGVLARGSVAGGLLVNKPAKPYLNYNEQQVTTAAQAITNISGANRSNAQTAIRFVLEQPAITSAVVGIRTMDQLKEAAEVVSTPKLTSLSYDNLQNVLPINTYEQHR